MSTILPALLCPILRYTKASGPKNIKDSKERYLLGQKHNLKIYGVIPIVRLQNDS